MVVSTLAVHENLNWRAVKYTDTQTTSQNLWKWAPGVSVFQIILSQDAPGAWGLRAIVIRGHLSFPWKDDLGSSPVLWGAASCQCYGQKDKSMHRKREPAWWQGQRHQPCAAYTGAFWHMMKCTSLMWRHYSKVCFFLTTYAHIQSDTQVWHAAGNGTITSSSSGSTQDKSGEKQELNNGKSVPGTCGVVKRMLGEQLASQLCILLWAATPFTETHCRV